MIKNPPLLILLWMQTEGGNGLLWSSVFLFPALKRLPQPLRRLIFLDAKSSLLGIALSLLELLLESRDVMGNAFGIGGVWINIPEPPAFAVRDELRPIFLRFALVHQPAIQGSSGQPVAIFGAHRLGGFQFRSLLRQLVGLPDVFQRFAMLEDQRRVKIIIGCAHPSLGEQFAHALATLCITLAQLPIVRSIVGRIATRFGLVGHKQVTEFLVHQYLPFLFLAHVTILSSHRYPVPNRL